MRPGVPVPRLIFCFGVLDAPCLPSSTWTDNNRIADRQHPISRAFRPYSRPSVRLQAGHLSRPTFTRRPLQLSIKPISQQFVSLSPHDLVSRSSFSQNEQILNRFYAKDVVSATVKVCLGQGSASKYFDSAVYPTTISRSFTLRSFRTHHPL